MNYGINGVNFSRTKKIRQKLDFVPSTIRLESSKTGISEGDSLQEY